MVDNIERAIRTVVPADELEGISDNIGLPISYDLAFYHTDSIGPQDADMLIQLKPKHQPTADYQNKIRDLLARKFPNVTVYFQAADIVSQVLNFGLPAAIDAQINGNDLQADYDIALRLQDRMRQIPGVSDLRIAEPQDYPTFGVDVDRAKALSSASRSSRSPRACSPRSPAHRCYSRISGSIRKSGVNYNVISQIAAAFDRLGRGAGEHSAQHSPVVRRNQRPERVHHYHRRRHGRPGPTARQPRHHKSSLGSRGRRALHRPARDRRRTPPSRAATSAASPPRCSARSTTSANCRAGTHVVIRGQSQAMRDSFRTLGEGIILAIILVYLLMVANFQSWLEPFIIMMAVPGALAGVLWMLAITGTTINVESLMGAIMAVGVSVANGNLLIVFANELREEGYSPIAAAIEAGRIRFRPIIMTALAMILGMLPMALALGSGSEQNAPLGTRRDRWIDGGHDDDVVRGACGLLDLQPQPHRQASARRRDRSDHAARCLELIHA